MTRGRKKNTKGKNTKGQYVQFLNMASPRPESESWIMAGKHRWHYAYRGFYGVALRKYDPIAFQVGYEDWRRER